MSNPDPAGSPAPDPAPAPTPAPTTAPGWEVFDSATPGQFLADWHTKTSEPEKWAGYSTAKNFQEFAELAHKRLADTQTALQGKGMAPARPTSDAAPESWTKYREAHGIPGTAEGYAFVKPEGMAEEIWDAPGVDEFSKWAHELHLPKEAAAELLNRHTGRLMTRVADARKAEAEAYQKFQAEESARLTEHFGEKLNPTLDGLQKVLTNDPELTKLGIPAGAFDPKSGQFWGTAPLALVATLLGRIPRGEDGSLRGMGSPQFATARDKNWAVAVKSPGHADHEAWKNAQHPEHAAVKAAVRAAFEAAAAAQAQDKGQARVASGPP